MSSPVRIYLKFLGLYDEKKKKMKQPSIFVYRSGSINIVVPKYDLLDKSYKFININVFYPLGEKYERSCRRQVEVIL